MNIENAYAMLDKYIASETLKKHMVYSAFILKEIAAHMNEVPNKWFIAGLLHDLDIEQEDYTHEKHGLITAELLRKEGYSDSDVIEAIKYHNAENNGLGERKEKLHFALSASESLSGLISAMALILPDKDIRKVKVKSLLKRMKEKAFARNVSREQIMECEKFDMNLEVFMRLALEGVKRGEDKLNEKQ